MITEYTLGCELEIADVDRRIALPTGNKWCNKDGTICNSSGVANDPKAKTVMYGGEIQVKPCGSEGDLLSEVLRIYQVLGTPVTFNWTTNLHVHIRIPGLEKDLEALKQITRYHWTHGKDMFNLIDPIPKPDARDFDLVSYQWAIKRYKRRISSHHFMFKEEVYNKMMAAETLQEFFEAEAPKDKNGKPQYQLATRGGVNLRQLIENTNTIEFRCFTCSSNNTRLLSAFQWPRVYLNAALYTGETPAEIVQKLGLEFQEFYPYNYRQDMIFQATSFYKNSRKVAEANIKKLLEEGIITQEDLV